MPRLDTSKKYKFIKLMATLSVDELQISDYNKIYLKKHLICLDYTVNLAWQIIELAALNTDKEIEICTIAEIGGGTGFISILAKYLGFGKVIYSDTFEPSCKDFEIISNALHLKSDAIICGGIEEIANKYKNKVDLIVSRDVIEHIYNPYLFFEHCILYFSNAILVHNTSANMYNIFKKNYFKKLHLKDESEGNSNQFKPGDSVEPFFQMRLDYILSTFPNLSISKKEILAAITRGMVFSDIKKAVENYINTEKLPTIPLHPSNTCDPANGNWSEHLISIFEYENLVSKFEYKTSWHFAPYDEWRNTSLKKIGLKFLNGIISISGPMAKHISPALVMVSSPIKTKV